MTNQVEKFAPESDVALYDDSVFDKLLKMAGMIAEGNHSVPDDFKGNVPDCMAIVTQSKMWGINPFAVIQKAHVIHGKIGYESQLVVSAINKLAPTKDRLHLEWFGPWKNIVGKVAMESQTKQKRGGGTYQTAPVPTAKWDPIEEEGLGVKVYATLNGEDQPRELELLLKQCFPRNSTLWASDPKQQIAYLAQRRWARLFCPDVILGVYTPDELKEQEPSPRIKDLSPESVKVIDDIEDRDGPASKKAIERIKGLLEEISPKDAKAWIDRAEEKEWKLTQDEAEKAISSLTLKSQEYEPPTEAQQAPEAKEQPQEQTEQGQPDKMTEFPAGSMAERTVLNKKYHAIGVEYFGAADWDSKRPELVAYVRPGSTSTKDLTNEEMGKAIQYMQQKQREAQQAQQ